MRPDITVTGQDGQQIAVVEVKSRENLSRDIATTYRRNMVAHGVASPVPFFVVISQDAGYLWKPGKGKAIDLPPDVEFSMDTIVQRYLHEPPKHRLIGTELQLLVLEWLRDLSVGRDDRDEEPEKALAEAGFSDSIRGGEVVVEALA
ncbi:MAG: hypothetical protein OJF49_003698 [Ktedonobacterales bacterium]|jgi:hypothetical protein|nr:MAG: hypothetical protein OJF49_003698 [Ktedonobacterales bacterium]